MTNPKSARTKIFVSYSHKDIAYLNKLHIHLARFKQQGLIWDDTEIRPGAKWHEQIEQALAATKIAILLVSADFLASNFIANEELPNLLKAAESEGTIILSLILSPCVYEDVLGDFQTVNPNARPLIAMDETQQEQTWVKLHVTVKQYLATAGIAADRLEAVGLGATKPVATNATPLGRAANRRVELVKR